MKTDVHAMSTATARNQNTTAAVAVAAVDVVEVPEPNILPLLKIVPN